MRIALLLAVLVLLAAPAAADARTTLPFTSRFAGYYSLRTDWAQESRDRSRTARFVTIDQYGCETELRAVAHVIATTEDPIAQVRARFRHANRPARNLVRRHDPTGALALYATDLGDDEELIGVLTLRVARRRYALLELYATAIDPCDSPNGRDALLSSGTFSVLRSAVARRGKPTA